MQQHGTTKSKRKTHGSPSSSIALSLQDRHILIHLPKRFLQLQKHRGTHSKSASRGAFVLSQVSKFSSLVCLLVSQVSQTSLLALSPNCYCAEGLLQALKYAPIQGYIQGLWVYKDS